MSHKNMANIGGNLIASFKDKDTENVFQGNYVPKFMSILKTIVY